MTRSPTISPREAARLGWTRVDQRPWSKCQARWLHRAGWRLEHCGHPTANYPWMLFHPDGRWVLMGMEVCGRPDYGGAWPYLEKPMRLVERVERGELVIPDPPYPEVEVGPKITVFAWPDQSALDRHRERFGRPSEAEGRLLKLRERLKAFGPTSSARDWVRFPRVIR